MWNKYKRSERKTEFEEYRKQRNLVKTRINNWKAESERRIVLSLDGDKKKFYRYVQDKQQVRTEIGQIKMDNGLFTATNVETTSTLGKFFESVFSREDAYTYVENVKDSKIPESEQINDILINEEIVKSKLLKLKENKAPGPDGVSPKVLKRCADSLALLLAAFFRKSLSEMKLPTDWKKKQK